MTKKRLYPESALREELAQLGLNPPTHAFADAIKEKLWSDLFAMRDQWPHLGLSQEAHSLLCERLKNIGEPHAWTSMPLGEYRLLHTLPIHPQIESLIVVIKASVIADIEIDYLSGTHTLMNERRPLEALVFVVEKGVRLLVGGWSIGDNTRDSPMMLSSKKGITKLLSALDMPDSAFEPFTPPSLHRK